ncbi:MAG TPA: hypothetical protein VL463_27670 [Kofleriaceae bacterium]|nr:hypothetical protein [Kofleriaceae bacterium]
MKKSITTKSLSFSRQTIRTLASNELSYTGGMQAALKDSGFNQCKSTQDWNWCTRFAFSECAC